MLGHNNNLLLSLKPPSFTLKFALERDLLKIFNATDKPFRYSRLRFSEILKDKQPITLKS